MIKRPLCLYGGVVRELLSSDRLPGASDVMPYPTPLDMPSCVGWYDGENVYVGSVAVASLQGALELSGTLSSAYDRSAYNRTLTPTAGTNAVGWIDYLPRDVASELAPRVGFSGGGSGAVQFLNASITGLSTVSAYTSMVVFNMGAPERDGTIYVVRYSTSNYTIRHHFTYSTSRLTTYINGTSYYGYFTLTPLDEPFLLTTIFDGSLTGNAERLKIFVNGSQKSLTFGGTIPASIAAPNTWSIGGMTTTDTSYAGGKFYAASLNMAAFTPEQRQALEASFAAAYGITLE